MRISNQSDRSSSIEKGLDNSKPQRTERAERTSEGKAIKRQPRIETDPSLKTDKVEVSGRAKEAVNAKRVAEAAPDVREDRVNEIKRKIASGQYKVDADAVADRMVDDHRQVAS